MYRMYKQHHTFSSKTDSSYIMFLYIYNVDEILKNIVIKNQIL